MKRDMDLIREILLQLEEYEHGIKPETLIHGRSDEEVGFHSYLILKAGLAEGDEETGFEDASPIAMVRTLTNQGYDFLEQTRDPTVWEQTKNVAKQTGAMSLALLVQIASGIATKHAMAAIGSA